MAMMKFVSNHCSAPRALWAPWAFGESLNDTDPIENGVTLFQLLVDAANGGESLGVGYGQFVWLIHGAACFEEVARRPYGRADTPRVLSLAHQVTAAAGNRKLITRNGVTLEAGMDTFIWQSKPPHNRPSSAFRGTAYSEEEWKAVFPDGTRRLLEYGYRLGRPSNPDR
jgi:hypothetical protein